MILINSILSLCVAAAAAVVLVNGAELTNKQIRVRRLATFLLLAVTLAIRNFASEKMRGPENSLALYLQSGVLSGGGAGAFDSVIGSVIDEMADDWEREASASPSNSSGAEAPNSQPLESSDPQLPLSTPKSFYSPYSSVSNRVAELLLGPDSDGDGIPDEWERWTHSDRFFDDSALDLDGDGLTTLEEFYHQTDHRVADTDLDGFSDGYEVSEGMNPLVKEDFTYEEPDADGNGIIDTWQDDYYNWWILNSLIGFNDSDGDGWDDDYARYYMPAASINNFDVEVNIYSSRSAYLSLSDDDNRLKGFVLFAGTTVLNLRLPLDTNTPVRLLPNLPDRDLPTNGLWKARIDFKFLPREWQKQKVSGSGLISDHGAMSFAMVEKEDVFVKFLPPASELAPAQQQNQLQGKMQESNMSRQLPSTITGDKIGWPHLEFLWITIDTDSSGYHNPDFSVGDFWVKYLAGGSYNTKIHASWRCEYGEMTPSEGNRSHLLLKQTPKREDKKAPVILSVKYDDKSPAELEYLAPPCHIKTFEIDVTENFSPHLGEEMNVNVSLPGCAHFADFTHMEIEVMREVKGGWFSKREWEHVAWVDMDLSTSEIDQYLSVSGGGVAGVSWDGIAQSSLSLKDHPQEFPKVSGKKTFNRAMPLVASGEPVPPPFYTVFVRLLKDGSGGKKTVVRELSKTVFVPQVVNIVLNGGEKVFMKSVSTQKEDGSILILHPEHTEEEAKVLLSQLPSMVARYIPDDINLRIVMRDDVKGRHKVVFIEGESPNSEGGFHFGQADEFIARNYKADGTARIYVGTFRKSLKEYYERYGGDVMKQYVFLQENMLTRYIAPTTIHEIAHILGLVDPMYLNAIAYGKQAYHNDPYTGMYIMDEGGLSKFEDIFSPYGQAYWFHENLRYLEFILPKTIK